MTASIFSPPKKLPLQALTSEDLRLQQRLLYRISQESLKRGRKYKERKLTLKAAEVESLFRLIDFGFSAAKLAGRYDGIEPRYFEPVFGKDRIRAVYPLDTGYSWLFGGVLHWQLTATPVLENNRLTVAVHDFRLGLVPLPRSISEKIMFDMLEELHSSPGYALFCKVIKKMYLEKDGSLVVVYSPARLLKLLTF